MICCLPHPLRIPVDKKICYSWAQAAQTNDEDAGQHLGLDAKSREEGFKTDKLKTQRSRSIAHQGAMSQTTDP